MIFFSPLIKLISDWNSTKTEPLFKCYFLIIKFPFCIILGNWSLFKACWTCTSPWRQQMHIWTILLVQIKCSCICMQGKSPEFYIFSSFHCNMFKILNLPFDLRYCIKYMILNTSIFISCILFFNHFSPFGKIDYKFCWEFILSKHF